MKMFFASIFCSCERCCAWSIVHDRADSVTLVQDTDSQGFAVGLYDLRDDTSLSWVNSHYWTLMGAEKPDSKVNSALLRL